MKRLWRWTPLFFALAMMGIVLALPVAGEPTADSRVYFSLVARDEPFSEHFDIRGLAPEHTILVLELMTGAMTRPLMFSQPGDHGVFWFRSIPLPAPGQEYRVSYYNGEYGNTVDPARVAIWHSAPIAEPSPNSTISIGHASLGGFYPKFPSELRQVALPHLFEWHGVPSESSTIRFYSIDGDLLHEVSDLSSHLYVFEEFPAGMESNETYEWELYAIEPYNQAEIIDRRRKVIFVEEPLLVAPVLGSVECSETEFDTAHCFFEWEAPVGATEYYFDFTELNRDFTETGSSTAETRELAASCWSNAPEEPDTVRPPMDDNWISRTMCDITFLSIDSLYQWRVRARNAATESDWSAWGTFTTPGCSPTCR